MSIPQQIPFKEIQSITNNFSGENLIGKGFLGNNYTGRLLSQSGESIDVAVRRLDTSFCLQEVAFDKEIKVLSNLKHENMVSIIGYHYEHENKEMIIVNKREALGSLNRHLSSPKLDWMKRLKISVGVASVLSYLHNDLKHKSVIHHNVNTASILLDEKWEAKLSGFEYSMTIPPTRDLDVAYEKLGIGTYKSDVFSFGIVLFEILCGAKAFAGNDDGSFQASSARFQYENGKLHEFVDPDIWKQMDQLSFKIFSEIAYYCLKDPRSCPNISTVLKRLAKALEYQRKHENPEESRIALEPTPSRLISKLKNLEHMRIQLKDISSATESFSPKKLISSGGFGTVYRGKLQHVETGYRFNTEGNNECEVAIKRISHPNIEVAQEGFYAEIELLTKCKHSNIIPLLGFCDEDSSMILVYEYAPNKSLLDYILNKTGIYSNSWTQRIKICIDVAKGLKFLHTNEDDKSEIVHRDIKSGNILLGKNFDAKIADFGLSTYVSVNEELNTSYYTGCAGTELYLDPQYAKEKKLKTEIDVYSFGVVLFEILCGKLANDPTYKSNNKDGLAGIARQYNDSKRTMMEMVDSKIREKTTESILTSVRGPNQESVDTFSNIAHRCLKKSQAERPTMEVVIEELQRALLLQENRKDIFITSFDTIKSVTETFSPVYLTASDRFWDSYEIKIPLGSEHTSIDVKRLRTHHDHEAEQYFDTEKKILMEYKHENMISLIGYCDEMDEKILVYEHASSGSLDMHLSDGSLTWTKRLEICIDIASGLSFIHERVIHGDIKSSNIQLDGGDMRAKVAGFRFSLKVAGKVFSTDFVESTKFYIDPEYERTGVLTKESDIYSFGVVLFEMFFQKLASLQESNDRDDHLVPMVDDLYKRGKLDEMVFEGTKEHIEPQSLIIYKRVAIQCLNDKREERPTAGELVIQLKEALKIQKKGMDIVRIPCVDIRLATQNFNAANCVGPGGFGRIYRGRLTHANRDKFIAAKISEDIEFYRELDILLKFKHRNVINLEGYCDENDEKAIVYEYTSKGSLDKHLNNASLTWMKRLEICIDIASGLEFLHGGLLRRETVIHRDIKSSNVVLHDKRRSVSHVL